VSTADRTCFRFYILEQIVMRECIVHLSGSVGPDWDEEIAASRIGLLPVLPRLSNAGRLTIGFVHGLESDRSAGAHD
jgi:hypothetical protein